MTNRRITTTAAVILSLAAAGAPTAAGRPAEDPVKSPVRVNSQSTFNDAAETKPALPPILPRIKPSERAAIQQAERQATALAPSKAGPYSTAELNAYADTAAGHVTAAAVGATTPHNSFDWHDAGIGAAAGFMLATLGLGGALAISQRRPRRHRAPALPS